MQRHSLKSVLFVILLSGPLAAAESEPQQLAAAPSKFQLILTANSTRIKQCDVLLLRTTVEHPDPVRTLFLELPEEYLGCHTQLQIKEADEWVPLSCIGENRNRGGLLVGGRQDVLPQSFFTEYHWLQRSGERFTFPVAGEYSLRAVAITSAGELFSNELSIRVEERDHDMLEFIRGSEVYSEFHPTSLYGGSRDTNDVKLDGNLERVTKGYLSVREYIAKGTIDEKPVAIKNLTNTLRARMDQVTWEYFLIRLGYHYQAWEDKEPLARIVAALPYDSAGARSFRSKLEYARTHPKKKPDAAAKRE